MKRVISLLVLVIGLVSCENNNYQVIEPIVNTYEGTIELRSSRLDIDTTCNITLTVTSTEQGYVGEYPDILNYATTWSSVTGVTDTIYNTIIISLDGYISDNPSTILYYNYNEGTKLHTLINAEIK